MCLVLIESLINLKKILSKMFTTLTLEKRPDLYSVIYISTGYDEISVDQSYVEHGELTDLIEEAFTEWGHCECSYKDGTLTISSFYEEIHKIYRIDNLTVLEVEELSTSMNNVFYGSSRTRDMSMNVEYK